jgi:histidine triad (HIT) family protein
MTDSIFTKIIKGEIPCHKIYEDEKTFAFLDIHPIQPGHTLVVPKVQIDDLWDLPDEDYRAVWDTARKVAKRLYAVLGAGRVGVKVIGLDVPHAHVHILPFNTMAEYRRAANLNADPEHESLAEIAKRLAF